MVSLIIKVKMLPWTKGIYVFMLMPLFSQVTPVQGDTEVTIKFLNYTVNTYGTEQGTQDKRCCVTGELLKPFICDKPCSPSVRSDTELKIKFLNYTVNTYGIKQGTQDKLCCVNGDVFPFTCDKTCSPSIRFCVSTDPFAEDACEATVTTSYLPPGQTFKAGHNIGNISNPVLLRFKSWSVSAKINILISAEQFNYTLILANSVIRPLIWPLPISDPQGWRTVVDNLDDRQVIAYQYKVHSYGSGIIPSDRSSQVDCQPGTWRNGFVCEDIDECQDKNFCNNGTCRNFGGSFNCRCTRGYTGKRCENDEDECQGIGRRVCGIGHSYCVNTIGSFKCQCDPGFGGHHCYRDINECLNNPCTNATSQCINTEGSFKCVCPPGFTGDNCDIDVDECKGRGQAECRTSIGHSYCVNTIGSFKCQCDPGFGGFRCFDDINECLNNPCTNASSVCINTVGSFKCVCPPGFTGDNCDIDVDECSTSPPCKNGATCINTVGSYNCQCITGFTGQHCELDIDECGDKSICKNNASCSNSVGSFQCHCVQGFTGQHCELDIDECVGRPCQNNGVCVNAVGEYYCDCPAGLIGFHCQHDHDECIDQPCEHNGTCINSIGSFNCQCTAGFSGKHCELTASQHSVVPVDTNTLQDLCLKQPCKNGGSCESLPHSYHCHCAPGFAGINCTLDFDECQYGRPCGQNGVCINTDGSYKCSCVNGFTGPICDRQISASVPNSLASSKVCEDTPGFPCHTAFNMCRERNIAEQQCRKTCGKCGTDINIVG